MDRPAANVERLDRRGGRNMPKHTRKPAAKDRQFFQHVKATMRTIEEMVASVNGTIPDQFDSSHTTLTNCAKNIAHVGDVLLALSRVVDPVRDPSRLYNPGSPTTIGKSIAIALTGQRAVPLIDLAEEPFYGGGVYALYYTGSNNIYAPISGKDIPIYVGKSDPEIMDSISAKQQGTKLWSRLVKDHLKNLVRAEKGGTIRACDFRVRFLVTLSGYQDVAERLLIHVFSPIWNKETGICHGFGKHGDKTSTRGNRKSPWDVLHPGRRWARDNKKVKSKSTDIAASISAHFAGQKIGKLTKMIRNPALFLSIDVV